MAQDPRKPARLTLLSRCGPAVHIAKRLAPGEGRRRKPGTNPGCDRKGPPRHGLEGAGRARGRIKSVTTAAAARDDTFPKLIARNARVRGGRTAFRHKDLGIWQCWTWAEMHEIVRAYAAGLKALGLR